MNYEIKETPELKPYRPTPLQVLRSARCGPGAWEVVLEVQTKTIYRSEEGKSGQYAEPGDVVTIVIEPKVYFRGKERGLAEVLGMVLEDGA